MPAQPPRLDDRTLPDILLQLQGRAAVDLPQWTPPPEGDAGTMLQRGFARLLELTLERLNGVPEKSLLAFLDAMGVSLLPPSLARAPLTFSLVAGTPPTLVPRGTQAGAQPSGQQAAPIFETEDDLTVIPAQLAQSFTVDPTWDRFAERTALLGGQSALGFTPFVGTTRLPHILYVGDDVLLDFSGPTTIEIAFDWQGALPGGEVRQFLERLVYAYRTQGTLQTVVPTVTVVENGATLRFTIADRIDQETIQGIGLTPGLQSRWLRARLATAFPDAVVAHSLRLRQVALRASASDRLPDLAFSNTAPLDVTRPLLPFGELPRVGDAFFIGSREVFATPRGRFTLTVAVQPRRPPTLIWEYWNGRTWARVAPTAVADGDGTAGFTRSGRIRLPRPAHFAPRAVDEETAFWFRVRLLEGGYQGAPQVSRFTLQWPGLTVPAGAGESIIRVLAPRFATTGTVLRVGDEPVFVLQAGEAAPQATLPFLQVTPPLLKTQPAGTPVERCRLSPALATLIERALAGSRELLVRASDEVNRGDLLLVDDTRNREFVVVTDVVGTERGTVIITREPLRFDHTPGESPQAITLRRVTSDLIGFAGGELVDFATPILPFGDEPGPGNVFYFGSVGGFLPRTDVDVELTMTSPNVRLAWDVLGADGWRALQVVRDETSDFVQSGDIVFAAQPAVAAEVNGQTSAWIRARMASGGYGRPLEFVAADPDDATLGFKVRPGSGNVNPPVITSLTLGYETERIPRIITHNGFLLVDHSTAATRPDHTFAPFVSVAELPPIHADAEATFYLAFDAAFAEQPVSLYVATRPRAFAGGVVKTSRGAPAPRSALPALRWDYFDGTTWRPLTVVDGTDNLTQSGSVRFLTPPDMAPLAKFDATPRYWVRARSAENDPFDTQQLVGVFLNTVFALQAVTVTGEPLGSSTERPSQVLSFARAPILPDPQVLVRELEAPSEEERTAIEPDEGPDAIQERPNPVTGAREIWVRWHEVANFLNSGPLSRHYTLDHTSGRLAFGDGRHGLIPPRGTDNVVATYRSGGGTAGNLPAAAITQVKSPLPGVAGVTNPVAADGGAEAETVAGMKERGPFTLRHHQRAVACDDFEWLARQAAGTRVARAKCLPNVNRDLRFEPGWTTLVVVPQGAQPKLAPSSQLVREVEGYLAERTFLGLAQQTPDRVNVVGPGYIQVAVRAEIVPLDIGEAPQVEQRALDALARFLHPLTGGPNRTGWEFARDVYESEVSQVLEAVPGVNYVKRLALIGNVAQHRLTCAAPLPAALPVSEGSVVLTTDSRKAAVLAEPLPAGASVSRLRVKGFKEGDRITRVQDFVVAAPPGGAEIVVQAVAGDAVGWPRGSHVATFDGTQRAELGEAILPGQPVTRLALSQPFARPPLVGDVLTAFYPFPLTITAVGLEPAAVQRLDVEPYTPEATFPAGSLLATLDNRVRLPLASPLPVDQSAALVRVAGFVSGETVTVPQGSLAPLRLQVQDTQSIDDIVYLDDNFLVYPGQHSLVMVPR